MLLGAILVPTVAHAQPTGIVSVNGGAEVIATGSMTAVSVPVQISGSGSINGFEIQVMTDITLLDPTGVSLSGSVLASPQILFECINGISIVGSVCDPQDGPGVVDIAAVQSGLTTAPTSGLLFTINYNIVGSTPNTPISFGPSVSDSCVISNGTYTPAPETCLGTSFSNLIDFTMASQYPQYSTSPGTPVGIVMNYASEGGYTDFLSESYTVTPSGPSCSFASGIVDLYDFTTGSDTLTCSGPAGIYTVCVTAIGQGLGLPTTPIVTHTICVTLNIVDFTIAFRVLTTFMGVNATISGTLGVYDPTSTLAGTTVLNVVNATTGTLIYSRTANATIPITSLGTAHFVEDIPTSPLWLATACEVNVNAGTVSCILIRTPDISHGNAVNVIDLSIILLNYGLPGYNAAADLTASGQVNIIDLSIILLYYGSTVISP
jgi:hypothetical protein